MKILIIDNYDSFTYNLYHMVEAVMPKGFSLTVRRNDTISLELVAAYDRIILSPGPGLPKNAGITCAIIERYGHVKPILGVCLGHQAIGEVFGGKLLNLDRVLHGRAIKTSIVDREEQLFWGCPPEFDTGRYHSWVIDPLSLPEELRVTAIDEYNLIMAIRHKEYDIRGVQFHPESIMTATGAQILNNWIQITPDSKPS